MPDRDGVQPAVPATSAAVVDDGYASASQPIRSMPPPKKTSWGPATNTGSSVSIVSVIRPVSNAYVAGR